MKTMSPKTHLQNIAIQQESKNKIIDAALALFAQKGYEGTSIKLIAKQAGISQGLLYNYFTSKEHLLTEIMALGMAFVGQAFDGIPDDVEPLQQLEILLDQLFMELEKQASFWRVFYSLRYLPVFNAILGDEIIRRNIALKNAFRDYYARAGIPDEELRARVLYAMVEGIIQQYLLFGEEYPLQDVIKEAIRLHCRQASLETHRR